jgi:hypothetical protein
MEPRRRKERLFDWLWLLAWGIASSAWCLSASGRLGATFDEPGDLKSGLDWWRLGNHHRLMKVGTMPLPMDIDTLPLFIWERWHGTRLDLLGTDLDSALPRARAGTLVFWWLLLIYGGRAGRHLAGPWGGRLAVALLACEPCLLAHATLATKDVAIAACLLAMVYHFVVGRDAGWWRRVGLPMFWFAAAVLSKASGLPFGPVCLCVVELQRLARAQFLRAVNGAVLASDHLLLTTHHSPLTYWWNAWRPFRRDLTQIMAGGLALVFLYCGSEWRTEPSFVAWAHSLPHNILGRTFISLSEHLPIFTNAGEGLIKQISHNIRGHGSWLLGQSDPRALWYYFPVALSIKLSLPLLIIPVVLGVLRPRVLGNWACLAAAALLLYSLTCRVQIGIRLMLPLVGLAIVGLAAALVEAGRGWRPGWRRCCVSAAACAAVLSTTLAAATVWPHALCYTNPLWGGTNSGYLCLSDSNYDWGQGLKELARWQERHHLCTIDIWYFGSDPAIHLPRFHEVPLQALPIERPHDVAAQVHGHYLAVSTSLLYGVLADSEEPGDAAGKRSIAWLRSRQPADRTTTFLIYDFTNEPAEAALGPSSL